MWVRLKRYFITGLVIFLPMALTVYALIATINFLDGFLRQYFEPYITQVTVKYIPGLSIIIAAYLILLIGFFASNIFGKQIYAWFEGLVLKLPFFKQVYPAIKEMAIFLFSRDQISQFKKVVLVEYPRKGMYAIGFLTNETKGIIADALNKDTVNVFVPSAPGPLTGYVLMVPKKEVIVTDIKIEDAFKFILSGGVVNPR